MALTRPIACPEDMEDSPYVVPVDMLDEVKPLPEGKKSAVAGSDPVRQSINEITSRAEALVRRVFVQHPNYDDIVQALLEHGLESLAVNVPLTVGIPLHPTLGSPTRSLNEIYDRLGDLPFTAEMKLDGQRGQIHGWRDPKTSEVKVKLFSRHLENMTEKVGVHPS